MWFVSPDELNSAVVNSYAGRYRSNASDDGQMYGFQK